MNSRHVFKNIIKVSLSNIAKLASGVCIAFILPKIVGITDYGFYKTFTLYATYVSLFALGFVDGIYLAYGGIDYEKLDKRKLSFYSRLYLYFQLLFSVIGVLIASFIIQGELRFIFLCVSVYLLANNITGYYQIVSQITGRFNELSLRNVIQSVSLSVSLLSIWGISRLLSINLSYRIFVIIYVFVGLILAAWYLFTYREITFSKTDSSECRISDFFGFVKLGLPLMVANLCSTLILSLDRQFVNIFFDTNTYAIYAFAYNMLSLITTAMAAISTVLYPMMKKSSLDHLQSRYSRFIEFILVLSFGCVSVFFLLWGFVDWFLPKYSESIKIFRIIIPGIAISSSITIVMHNYYKTIGKNFEFFIKCVVVLFISICANLIAFFLFKTTESISIASIIVMLFWYFLMDEYFVRTFKADTLKNTIYLFIMIISFYSTIYISSFAVGLFVYLLSYCAITLSLFGKDISNAVKKYLIKSNRLSKTKSI